jgi:hypothetical protein
MVYRCETCNFSTKLKSNYTRHLKTKKHIIKFQHDNTEGEEISDINIDPTYSFFPSKTLQTTLQNPPNSSKSLQDPPNPSKSLQEESKKNILNQSLYECEYCNRTFTRKDNLNKHQKGRCQQLNKFEKKIQDLKDDYEATIQRYENEKQELYKHIDRLLEKVGDTNITQNLVVNCYGKEDLSHINNTFKAALLKIPYGMIPKMIEEVHFSVKCPQNNNIYVPNKKEPYVKIFADDKWIYKDRKSTIKELIDTNYNRIDEYYQHNGDTILDESQQKRYLEFTLTEKETKDEVEKKVDLLLLNKNK